MASHKVAKLFACVCVRAPFGTDDGTSCDSRKSATRHGSNESAGTERQTMRGTHALPGVTSTGIRSGARVRSSCSLVGSQRRGSVRPFMKRFVSLLTTHILLCMPVICAPPPTMRTLAHNRGCTSGAHASMASCTSSGRGAWSKPAWKRSSVN